MTISPDKNPGKGAQDVETLRVAILLFSIEHARSVHGNHEVIIPCGINVRQAPRRCFIGMHNPPRSCPPQKYRFTWIGLGCITVPNGEVKAENRGFYFRIVNHIIPHLEGFERMTPQTNMLIPRSNEYRDLFRHAFRSIGEWPDPDVGNDPDRS